MLEEGASLQFVLQAPSMQKACMVNKNVSECAPANARPMKAQPERIASFSSDQQGRNEDG